MTFLESEALVARLEKAIKELTTLNVYVTHEATLHTDENRHTVRFIVVISDYSDPKRLELRRMYTAVDVNQMLDNDALLRSAISRQVTAYAIGRFMK